MELNLYPRHFKGAEYTAPDDCPIARALKEEFNTDNVEVGPFVADIEETRYFKLDYDTQDYLVTNFKYLQKVSQYLNKDEIVYTVILTEI